MTRDKFIKKKDITYNRAIDNGHDEVILFTTKEEIESLKEYEIPAMMQTTGQPVSNQQDFETGFKLGWNSAILEIIGWDKKTLDGDKESGME